VTTTEYTVGKVAELAGVTVRTLHHYEQIGLLEPEQRSRSGYRQYSTADLDRLHHILYYRELGFPLPDIATIRPDTCGGNDSCCNSGSIGWRGWSLPSTRNWRQRSWARN